MSAKIDTQKNSLIIELSEINNGYYRPNEEYNTLLTSLLTVLQFPPKDIDLTDERYYIIEFILSL